ncbi:MAG: DUF2207 family protein [Peptostreptococcaceae bacterium]
MRKLKQGLAILLLTLICINTKVIKSNAEDDGYYIKNMDVQVQINDKREYKITETIDVYFNEDRHGIIRNIPTSSSLEDYEVSDVKVEGAPYEIEDYGEVSIRIGDPDETVYEDQQYKITYKLKHFSDEQPEGDYIYLNVLGTEWDTRVENFTSTITYPKDAKLEKIKVTDGEYGSAESTYANYDISNNTINIKSKQEIPPYSGITVNAMLNEGAFKNAPIKQYPYTVNQDIMNVQITEDKEYLINRTFIIDINKEFNDGHVQNIYLWDIDNNENDYIKDIKLENSNVPINIWKNNIEIPTNIDNAKIEVSYKIEPRLNSPIDLYIGDYYRKGKTENLEVNVNAPFKIQDYNVSFNESGVNSGTDRYKINLNDNMITLKNNNAMLPYEKIKLSLDIDNSLFSRQLPTVSKFILIVAPLLLLIVFFIYSKNKNNNQIISSVEFYPPNNMSSAEVAYAFKQGISLKDITSLIFYWASQNHIKINIKNNDKFTLTKVSELDFLHKEYERELFEEIFNCGTGEVVSESQLEGEIYTKIVEASSSVRKLFKGDKEIGNAKSFMSGFILSGISSIPMILCAVLGGELLHLSSGEYLGIGLGFLVSLVICFSIFYSFNKLRYSKKGKRNAKIAGIVLGIVYFAISSIILTSLEVPIYLSLIGIGVSFICMIMSTFIPRRSDYGREILEQIIGFRNFVETAEKDRLEALLEEDPEYFYNTLPYAQVLGITKKWTEKFEGITMQPPTFYETYYPMNNLYMMSHLMNDMDRLNSSMTKGKDDGSSGGSSGGSGGGFSGGGFSGGGSGGGGGSSW